MAELKTDPFNIDINLISSLGLQKQLTDYVDILTVFPDETVLNHIYWHTDSHSDPITSKVDFFKKINDGQQPISEAPIGTHASKTTDDKLYNKNVRDQLPGNVQLVTPEGVYGLPDISGTGKTKVKKKTYTKVWSPLEDGIMHENANGKWVITNDPPEEKELEIVDRTELQQSPTDLADMFGMKDMSPWFTLWWIEKFKTAHTAVKTTLLELLGDSNEYFVNFSESVGQLKNTTDNYDNSTSPVYDISVEAYGDSSVPSNIPGIAQYCVKPETLTLATELAKDTNVIYRGNMFNHSDDSSRDVVRSRLAELPVNSHGCNLMNDNEHPKRMMRFIDVVREEIETHLKGLYGVLELLSNRENYMVVGKPRQILLKVEGFTQSVDLFKNKIKSYNLDGGDVTTSRYGKHAYYNNSLNNSDYLA